MKPSRYAIFSLSFVILVFLCAMSVAIAAQDVTHPSTSKTTGPPKHAVHQTHIKNAEVLHVAGHDVLVQLENGRLELLDLPKDFMFQVDGKSLSVHELKPGTRLTQEIHTVTTPQEVTTVRTVNGKVWYVSGRHLILSFPDGQNKKYTVPDGIVFNIGGEEKTVFDLRKGMEISATVVTVAPHEVVTKHTIVAGQAPRPAALPFEGPLLIEPLVTMPVPAVTAEAKAPPAPELPKTASPVPLTGLLGLLFLALSAGLRIVRSKTA